MPKKRSQPRRPGTGGTPQQLQEGIDQADSLISRKRWIEARAILEPLDQRYPNRYDVLAVLSNIYFELNEYGRYLDVAMQLARLAPRNPDIALMLAGAYLSNIMPVLALRSFRQVLKRWPEHPRADDIQAEIAKSPKWSVRQRVRMSLTDSMGETVDSDSRYASHESKDGTELQFAATDWQNGSLIEETVGSAVRRWPSVSMKPLASTFTLVFSSPSIFELGRRPIETST